MKKFSIGYIALSKASWATPEIKSFQGKTVESLKTLPFNIIHADDLTTTSAEAVDLCNEFKQKGIDAVILHFVTFPVGAIIPVIAQNLDVPMILFASPEKPTESGVWAQNSFCGANMAAYVLHKMNKKYSFVFGPGQDAGKLLGKTFNTLSSVDTISKTKIGLVGGRVPGFYTSNFDELKLRASFGTEVEIIDLLEVVETAKNLSDEEIEQGVEVVKNSSHSISPTVQDEIIPAGKLFQAFKKVADKYDLSTFAVRCWPDLPDFYGIAPCAILGMLNNCGLPTSCEGDVLGAVLMRIQESMSGKIPFFADLISFDYEQNTAVLWHCGAAAVGLCDKFEDSILKQHFRVDGGDKKGLVNEFPLKPGRITLAQLDETEDGYRMLIASGEALKTEIQLRGNPLDIRFDGSVQELIKTIIDGGFQHHYSVIHADIKDELLAFCEHLNIKTVVVE
jgi:L-fucose isomerase-like protein